MNMKIKFVMDNEAFHDAYGLNSYEVVRILRQIADDIEVGGIEPRDDSPIYDVNGNPCGGWRVSDR